MDRGKVSFLGASALLSRLPPAMLARAVRRTTPVRVRRRREVWRVGDVADHLYFVRSGVVRVGRQLDDTHEITYAFHGKGDIFGEVGCLAAVQDAPAVRHSDAFAHEELALYALPAHELRGLLEQSAEVGIQLAALVADRRRRVEDRLGLVPFRSVPSRVAIALLDLAAHFGVRDSRGIIVNLRLTHRELASLVGSTRETVSAELSRLRRAHVLAVESKRVVLLDLDALQARADAS